MIELASWSTAAGDWVEPEPLDDEPVDDEPLDDEPLGEAPLDEAPPACEGLELLPHALNEAPASTNAAAIAPATRLELIRLTSLIRSSGSLYGERRAGRPSLQNRGHPSTLMHLRYKSLTA